MNRDRFQGICMQIGGKLKRRWGTLTGDRLAAAAGSRDELAGRNREQRGISKQAADRQLEDFRYRNRDWSNLPGR